MHNPELIKGFDVDSLIKYVSSDEYKTLNQDVSFPIDQAIGEKIGSLFQEIYKSFLDDIPRIQQKVSNLQNKLKVLKINTIGYEQQRILVIDSPKLMLEEAICFANAYKERREKTEQLESIAKKTVVSEEEVMNGIAFEHLYYPNVEDFGGWIREQVEQYKAKIESFNLRINEVLKDKRIHQVIQGCINNIKQKNELCRTEDAPLDKRFKAFDSVISIVKTIRSLREAVPNVELDTQELDRFQGIQQQIYDLMNKNLNEKQQIERNQELSKRTQELEAIFTQLDTINTQVVKDFSVTSKYYKAASQLYVDMKSICNEYIAGNKTKQQALISFDLVIDQALNSPLKENRSWMNKFKNLVLAIFTIFIPHIIYAIKNKGLTLFNLEKEAPYVQKINTLRALIQPKKPSQPVLQENESIITPGSLA